MRVLHVISEVDPKHGGPTAALITLATAQVRAGLDVRVVGSFVPGANMSAMDQLRGSGIPVTLIGPTSGPLRRHPDLGRTVERCIQNADVVHMHAIWEEIFHVAVAACRDHGIPCVWRPCGMLAPWSLAQDRWKKQLVLRWRLLRDLNRAGAMHYTTQDEEEQARPLRLSAPAIVEPNGLDLTEFRDLPPRGYLRSMLGISTTTPVILSLGRLHAKKQPELLVCALADVRGPAVLVIAGPSEDGTQERVRALAQQLGIEDRVVTPGPIPYEARVQAMADCDVFVLPSLHENFGVAVVEAMACGAPVLISDQVGIHADVVRAGAGRVLPLDRDQWVEALHEALGDKEWRVQAGQQGRELAFDHFDVTKVERRWQEHYALLSARMTSVSAPETR